MNGFLARLFMVVLWVIPDGLVADRAFANELPTKTPERPRSPEPSLPVAVPRLFTPEQTNAPSRTPEADSLSLEPDVETTVTGGPGREREFDQVLSPEIRSHGGGGYQSSTQSPTAGRVRIQITPPASSRNLAPGADLGEGVFGVVGDTEETSSRGQGRLPRLPRQTTPSFEAGDESLGRQSSLKHGSVPGPEEGFKQTKKRGSALPSLSSVSMTPGGLPTASPLIRQWGGGQPKVLFSLHAGIGPDQHSSTEAFAAVRFQDLLVGSRVTDARWLERKTNTGKSLQTASLDLCGLVTMGTSRASFMPCLSTGRGSGAFIDRDPLGRLNYHQRSDASSRVYARFVYQPPLVGSWMMIDGQFGFSDDPFAFGPYARASMRPPVAGLSVGVEFAPGNRLAVVAGYSVGFLGATDHDKDERIRRSRLEQRTIPGGVTRPTDGRK